MHIFLVRHGDSPFTAADDHQRPLSKLGEQQAKLAGKFIYDHSQGPHKIICSDALRTRLTAELINQVIRAQTISAFEHLYHARIGDWCDVIQQQHDDHDLVLVGHNPTMTYLAKYLQPLAPQTFSPASVGHYQLEIAADGLRLPAQLSNFFKPDAK